MSRSTPKELFRKPSAPERMLNRLFGVVVGFGGGLTHNYLLQVRGRKSGRLISTPVNLLTLGDRLYLVAPRGNTQWVRNVRNSSRASLKKGADVRQYRVRELPDADKPMILQEYLNRYRTTVQRYFSIPADSDPGRFVEIAGQHPVFALEQADDAAT